jgi:hypothetical protein
LTPRAIADRAPRAGRHRAQDDMLGGVAERVHQPHGARLLAAEREGRVAMEDAHRRSHVALWRSDARRGTR